MIPFFCGTDIPVAYVAMMATFIIYALLRKISPFKWIEDQYTQFAKSIDLEILFLSVPVMFLFTFWPILDNRLCGIPYSYWFIILFVGGAIGSLIVASTIIEKKGNQSAGLFESIFGSFLGALLAIAVGNFSYFTLILLKLMSFISPNQGAFSTAYRTPEITNVELVEDWEEGNLIVYQQIAYIDRDGDAQKTDYEIVDSTNDSVYMNDGVIRTPGYEQRLGALTTGTWYCDQDEYTVTLQVSIIDAAGNKSPPYRYTVRCY
jgi:hypothetical protein